MPPAERPRPGPHASATTRPDVPRARPDALEAAPPVPPARPGRGAARAPLRTVEETSAGGVVVDQRAGAPHVAVIARINRGGRLEWCLPKGHLEGAETPEEAAVREIAEETGIEGEVVRSLGSIDYWFSVEGRRVHKTVHHYLLTATGGDLSIEGDPDAEAVDAAWVRLDHLAERLAFSNERRIARAVTAILTEGA